MGEFQSENTGLVSKTIALFEVESIDDNCLRLKPLPEVEYPEGRFIWKLSTVRFLGSGGLFFDADTSSSNFASR